MPSVVVCFSGGLDSTALLLYGLQQGFEMHPMVVDYGQANAREIYSAEAVSAFFRTRHSKVGPLIRVNVEGLPLSTCAAAPEAYVPGRNAVLLAVAVSHAEAHGCDAVWLGVTRDPSTCLSADEFWLPGEPISVLQDGGWTTKGVVAQPEEYPDAPAEGFVRVEYPAEGTYEDVHQDRAVSVPKRVSPAFPDVTPEFIHRIGPALNEGVFNQVVVEAPLAFWSKTRVVDFLHGNGIPLDLTWSCYASGVTPCGVCGACKLRKVSGA